MHFKVLQFKPTNEFTPKIDCIGGQVIRLLQLASISPNNINKLK